MSKPKLTDAQKEILQRMKNGYMPSCAEKWQSSKGLIKKGLIKANYGSYQLTDLGKTIEL